MGADMKKVLFLLFLALAAYGQQISVAVLPSDGDAKFFDNNDLEALTSKIRSAALNALPRETFAVLTQDVVIRRLGGAENYIKECTESSCIVDLGKKAQVDYIAQASVGKLRDKMMIRVEVYSVSTSELVGIYDGGGKYFDDYFDLLAAVERNVPKIFKKIPDATLAQAKPAPAKPISVAPVVPQYVPPAPKYVPPEKTILNEEKRKKISELDRPLEIQKLIKNGLKKNKEEIKKESFYLPSDVKEILYNENKNRAAWAWALLNMYFGLGSYIQGDIISGIILTVGEGLGMAAIAMNDKNNGKEDPVLVLAITTFMTSSIVAGWIFPFVHQSSYNKALKGALNYDDDFHLSYSIDPLIIPKDGAPAVGLALNLRY